MKKIVILLCMVLFKASVELFKAGVKRTCIVLASVWTFYSSRTGNYNETQGPIGDPGAGKILCRRALMARSRK
jgi:DNA-directed RNA polymerase subunit N (RpoN/RPB10)